MSFKKKKNNDVCALIFIEGDTEEEFYKIVFSKYLGTKKRKIKNLHGLYNAPKKMLDKTFDYLDNYTENIRIYCFIDRESRTLNVPINLRILIEQFIKGGVIKRILSINMILATPMIESWFFYDIEGIYNFLRAKQSKRNPQKYQPPVSRFDAHTLNALFKQFRKYYTKGSRTRNFISHLDIDKIYESCEELRKGIQLILKKS